MHELRKNIETLAAEESKTALEICSMLQAGAAKIGDEDAIATLAKVKMEIYMEGR